jgi:hypothetical protein
VELWRSPRGVFVSWGGAGARLVLLIIRGTTEWLKATYRRALSSTLLDLGRLLMLLWIQFAVAMSAPGTQTL